MSKILFPNKRSVRIILRRLERNKVRINGQIIIGVAQYLIGEEHVSKFLVAKERLLEHGGYNSSQFISYGYILLGSFMNKKNIDAITGFPTLHDMCEIEKYSLEPRKIYKDDSNKE